MKGHSLSLTFFLLLLISPPIFGPAQSLPDGVPAEEQASTHTAKSLTPRTTAEFNGHTYEVIDKIGEGRGRMNWLEAHEVAIQRGGHLVCIETDEEWDFIERLLENGPHNLIWTGGFYSNEKGWIWINGKPVDESRLKDPSKKSDVYRVSANNNKGVDLSYHHREGSENTGGFIVEFPGEKVTLTLPDESEGAVANAPPSTPPSMPPSAPAPTGGTTTSTTGFTIPETAVEFNGSYYEVIQEVPGGGKERMGWLEAQEIAAGRGGYLVCIETDEEWEFMANFMKNSPKTHLWTGGYYSKEDGWMWITGKPIDESRLDNPGNRKTTLRVYANNTTQNNKFNDLFYANRDFDNPAGGFIIEYSPNKDISLFIPGGSENAVPTMPPAAPITTSPTQPSDPSTTITGSAYSKNVAIKRNQTKVNGLLVMSLGAQSAGSASPMTLIALPADPSQPATLGFNQEVGSSMLTALGEVSKFVQLRHNGWPKGRTLEISFENKYNPKDGPSAAVACALLLESAITGKELDAGFAVTGDMNADGSVQPVGGIEAKVRGATNRHCTHIAVPHKNLSSVYDTILMDGIKPIMEIQVFSISGFEEARALAVLEKPAETQKAIEEFATIQDLYRKDPGSFATTIRHPKVMERLQGILSSARNHVSATILLDYASGSGPKSLSLHGSVAFIDENAYQIVDVIKDGEVAELGDFDHDQVANAIALLRRNKLKLDKRTWPWADSLTRWGELMREYQTNRPKAASNLNRMIDEINRAGQLSRELREMLLENPEVMEELLE